MKVETIKTQLKSLHLSAAASEVEEVLSRHGAAADLSWLAELLERELDARRERAIMRRIENAEFLLAPVQKCTVSAGEKCTV